MNDKIKAYKDILKVAKKYSDIFGNDGVPIEVASIQSVIKTLEICSRFGMEPKYLSFSNYIQVKNSYDEWTGIAFFSETADHPIGCSDTGEQPKNEWLFTIRFTCGAYIFGDSYPTQTFTAFFNELKSFEPKYVDSANKALYFTEDKAKAVHEAFWPIFKKYKALVADEVKAKRKAELEAELAALAEAEAK
jgi:hypothetical protein